MYVLCNFAITVFLFIGGFPGSSDGKESAFNAGDMGLIPGSRDPLKKGVNSYPLQYSCLENSLEIIVQARNLALKHSHYNLTS